VAKKLETAASHAIIEVLQAENAQLRRALAAKQEICFACGHAREFHNQDIGNGEMNDCSECGCHGFASSTDDEMLAQFTDA
jgi:hypothetical protein